MTDRKRNQAKQHLGWNSRGFLPHCDYPGLAQSVSFRLFDSVPASVIEQWVRELTFKSERMKLLQKRMEQYIDAGYGACFLAEPSIASLVENSLLHFNEQRYELLAWCIMPNHVHVLLAQLPGFPISKIVHSWKSYSSKLANLQLKRQGIFWARDYFDQFMKSSRQFESTITYIEQNPVKAGLVKQAEAWNYSSASATNFGQLSEIREKYREIDSAELPWDN